jgi:hypothetical protein
MAAMSPVTTKVNGRVPSLWRTAVSSVLGSVLANRRRSPASATTAPTRSMAASTAGLAKHRNSGAGR